ncbi:hypothetical protein ABI_21960 [Asticcacaulis biprosthecium C19]|uniref:Uncharacterized protein n=1 Tax=Asticcacaulis biprosthecium C19 TaxID=715226 RepID=F4QH01_9CAUL|nr:hypothetical protein [Asticcacaulis biprosthecium]EGF93754.1 hypothetical protein ABI_21960 [Asticcacaulis biprosthecium C19]
MTAPRHIVLVGGARGRSGSPVFSAFDGAERRSVADRIPPVVRSVADTGRGSLTAREWLQAAIDAASEQAMRLGQRVYLSTEGRLFDIGSTPIQMRSGVDLDLSGSILTHQRVSNTSGASVAITGSNLRNFSIVGGEVYGPGSWTYQGKVYGSSTYAFQFSGCSQFDIDLWYYNGNSGLLLSHCTQGNATVRGYELNGPALAVKGGSELTIAAGVRNSAGFGIYGDQGASKVHVLWVRKWVDDTRLTAGSHPYLWSQREISHKVALNRISGAVWSADQGGRTTFTVTRNPTVDQVGIPKLSVGKRVRISHVESSVADAFNGEFEIVAMSGGTTESQVVVAHPASVSPGSYVAGKGIGRMADLETTWYTLGEEALGVTYSCTEWTCDYLYAHRTGDAACSLTGDRMHVRHAEAVECHLGGVHMSGRGSRVDLVTSYYNGHWNSSVAKFGGVAGSVGSSAGNYAQHSSFGKIISRQDITGGGRIDRDWRYANFTPGGECGRAYGIVASGTTTEIAGVPVAVYWIFRVKGATPDYFGEIDPVSRGFVAPEDGDLVEAIWNDGESDWVFRRAFAGSITPIAPVNCYFGEIDYDGPAVRMVDHVGSGYGNRYPSLYEPYGGPPILLNGEFLQWPAGTLSLTGTGTEWAAGWYGARSGGNAMVSRIAGKRGRYAVRLKRSQGTGGGNSLLVAQSITGDRLHELKGRYPSFRLRAWCGATWSDNNQQLSWDLKYRTSVAAMSDSDLDPDGIDLSNGACPVTTAEGDVSFTSAAAVPAEAEQLILRIYYTPTLGSARSVTVTAGGSGYAAAPQVVFGGGGSHGEKVWPTAHAVVAGGKVTSVVVDFVGANLEGIVTVSLDGGGGSGAMATCRVYLIADDEDWLAFERPVCAPSDSDFSFVREPVEVTRLRLGL